MHPYLIACLINNNCHISLRSNLLMKHASEIQDRCAFFRKNHSALCFFRSSPQFYIQLRVGFFHAFNQYSTSIFSYVISGVKQSGGIFSKVGSYSRVLVAYVYACRHYCCGKAVLILWVGFITNQKP